MFDYLADYRLSETEREKLLYSVLKRINHSSHDIIFKKKKNMKLWHKIEKIYDKDCLRKAIDTLLYLKLIEPSEQQKVYVRTKRGMIYLKRGYISYKKDMTSKYALYISIIAIITALFSVDIRHFIIWLLHVI